MYQYDSVFFSDDDVAIFEKEMEQIEQERSQEKLEHEILYPFFSNNNDQKEKT